MHFKDAAQYLPFVLGKSTNGLIPTNYLKEKKIQFDSKSQKKKLILEKSHLKKKLIIVYKKLEFLKVTCIEQE